MINIENYTHNPVLEEIVDVLCAKTQNTDRNFFRAEVAYFLGKMAACMRATIITKDRGNIPVSIYSLVLATSGFGKNHSINIIENEFLSGFKQEFIDVTMPILASANLNKLAAKKAVNKGTTPEEELERYEAAYNRCGAYAFTFDSGTAPAIKQLRQKLLMADCGSINYQCDEIGSNLISSTEVLNVFLELFDQGIIKQKLTKNTNDNQRGEELDGKTPTNMLLFGTPSKLFDGGQTEDMFYSMMETGYARRCIFGYGSQTKKASHIQTPEEIFKLLTQPNNTYVIGKYNAIFTKLAKISNFNWKIRVEDPVAIELIRYKVACENISDALPEHKEIQKAELNHRYFKALKLAGAYAFIDNSSTLDQEYLQQAILLIEESGAAFQKILNREKSYVKLAKFIAAEQTELTHADLHEALPFYKSSSTARNEMISLAIAWGYKQHILIKKTFIDGIEFLSGETLKETNLEELTISYSDHFAYNYIPDKAPFKQLTKLVSMDNMNWCNHQFINKHRTEENAITGFDMIVVDIDGTTQLDMVHSLLAEYTFMTYTTKRHTEQENRFRLIIPMNYRLDLSQEEYKEFMNNFSLWLPFKIDMSTHQRSRKWATHKDTHIHHNEGETLNVLKFIPKTSKNEEFKQNFQKLESLDNLERWFAASMTNGNRNNQLIKYALLLVDQGMSFNEVEGNVIKFNKSLQDPLTDSEIRSTILVTVAKKYNP